MSHEKRSENEAVFRAANERLKDRVSGVGPTRKVPFICECSDADCLEAVPLALPEYEEVRAQGKQRYFVLPGHNAGGERVVEHRDGFVIVEKMADQEAA